MSTTESCFSASSVRNHIPLQMVFIIINTHSTLARKLPKISPLKRVSQEWHWSPKKLKNSKREKIFIIKKAKWPSNKVSSFFNDNGNLEKKKIWLFISGNIITGILQLFLCPQENSDQPCTIYLQEARKQSIQRCIQSLVHACQCRDANCRLPSCHKVSIG